MGSTLFLVLIAGALIVAIGYVSRKPGAAAPGPSQAPSPLSWMPPEPILQLTAREQDEREKMSVVQEWYKGRRRERFEKEVLTELGEMINSQSM